MNSQPFGIPLMFQPGWCRISMSITPGIHLLSIVMVVSQWSHKAPDTHKVQKRVRDRAKEFFFFLATLKWRKEHTPPLGRFSRENSNLVTVNSRSHFQNRLRAFKGRSTLHFFGHHILGKISLWYFFGDSEAGFRTGRIFFNSSYSPEKERLVIQFRNTLNIQWCLDSTYCDACSMTRLVRNELF